MAAPKSKAQPVGSSQWIQSERQQASDFISQEVEEFGYSARNELEWLNEHMADVFSTARVNFADVFKTPGKLRGKTPRTARKRDALAPRQPLADIFAPSVPQTSDSPQRPTIFEKAAQFEIAEDVENAAAVERPISGGRSPRRPGVPCTDSGYHGLTEDEMDVFAPQASIDASTQGTAPVDVLTTIEEPMQQPKEGKADDTAASDDSFVSAKEQDAKDASRVVSLDAKTDMNTVESQIVSEEAVVAGDTQPDSPMGEAPAYPDLQELASRPGDSIEADVEMDDADADAPHSELSSPEKPMHRKSSFTFSALPAREPLGAKKSMGHLDNHRSSTLGKSFGTKGNDAEDEDEDEDIMDKLAQLKEPSKTSTQLLHERINLLGKTKDSRSSKIVPASALSGGIVYPQIQEMEFDSQDGTTAVNSQVTNDSQTKQPTKDDDDDDWIAPAVPAKTAMHMTGESRLPQVQLSPNRPVMHQKSISTTDIPSPRPDMPHTLGHQKSFSVTQFNESTTPAGSPTAKRTYEGPLSASKNRLWSALKSAKNIFASSASASAAAKLEAHNSSMLTRQISVDESRDAAVFNMPGAMYSERQLPQSPSRPTSAISHSPSRKTRSSTESDRKREKDAKSQQKAVDDLEKAREKERQKAAKQQQEEKAKAEKAEAKRLEDERREAAAQAERPVSTDGERDDMSSAPSTKSGGMSLGKLRAPGRLLKPSKETLVSKPVPVSIRVTAQSQRLGQGASSQSSLAKSQHESSAPTPLAAKDGSLRAASVQSNRPGSAAPSGARVRALEAAARKKEADAKAAQKKADQKRELERKRAAKAEEEKRAEDERKAAEQQRAQEAKLAAQRKAAEKQALEARKREQERAEQQRRDQERDQERIEQERRERERAEQQRRELETFRQQEEARKAKEAHDLAEAIRRERAQQMPAHPRGDVGGTLRQLVKSTIPVQNGAKPIKRVFNPDDEAFSQNQQRPPIQRGPPSYQQTDAKRRRTSEEPQKEPERHSVMAPPKRPSNWRKDTLSKFPHGYSHAPPPAQHHNTMYKKPGQPMHPSQLVQVSNARIPFADNNNPPGSSNYATSQSHLQQQQQQHHHNGYDNYNNNKFKTPARPAPGFPKSAGTTKPQTPSYLQGDAIELPDIATDSEDEESDDERGGGPGGGFRAPSWVASPALRDLLTQQQLVDPESVFGPIGELKMDEVFKNGKNADRLKRFRDRGSSAMWVESGDAVTSAEKKRDMELRERVARDGGWRYEPGAL